jgi:hypothetical protein
MIKLNTAWMCGTPGSQQKKNEDFSYSPKLFSNVNQRAKTSRFQDDLPECKSNWDFKFKRKRKKLFLLNEKKYKKNEK